MIKFSNIDLNGIKGALLDLDNTLYHYDSCHLKAINECYSHYKDNINKNLSFADFSNIYRQKRDLVTKRLSPQGACRSRLFAFQAMFEEANLERGFELAKKYDEIYWSNLIGNMKLAKDASIFLKNCQDLSIDICIVSDMIAHIQVKKLQKLGIAQNIKYLVTSEEIGAEKPDPRMFQAALNKLNLSPKEVIMIGDSENKDIKGAQALGIKSYKVLVENL
jgi:putative hydrolase of the HAD superfamily